MFEMILSLLRTFLRDKSGVFFSFIFPILLVFILGNMLADLDNPDQAIETIRIEYALASGLAGESAAGPAGERDAAAVSAFIGALGGNESLELRASEDFAAARAAVDAGKSDAALFFETPLHISVYEGADTIKSRAAVMIAQGFSRQYTALALLAQTNPQAFAELAVSGLPSGDALSADKDLGVTRSMQDYYAVTMIVMIAFMGSGIAGATTMYAMRENGTIRRLTLSPGSRSRLFLESVLGFMPQTIGQALAVMIPSALLLGAHYAKTWQDNLLLFAFFFLLGMTVTALFMVFGLFVRFNPYMPIMAALWALLFLSGTFSKEVMIQGVSEYLPMNIAQQAAFDLTIFGRPEKALLVMLVCAAILAVSCVIGSLLLKRKEIVL
jgi:ABC-2 type transport system permease protein